MPAGGHVSDYSSLTTDHLHPRWIVFVPAEVRGRPSALNNSIGRVGQEFDARNPGSTLYCFRVQVPLDLPPPVA